MMSVIHILVSYDLTLPSKESSNQNDTANVTSYTSHSRYERLTIYYER